MHVEQNGGAPSLGKRQTNLKDMLALVIRRRWVILGVSLPIILVAIFGTLRTIDSASASSRVLIEGRPTESPSFHVYGVDYDVLMSAASQIAVSIPVATKAAASLIDSLASLREDPKFKTPIENERGLRNLLLRNVDASPVGESNILAISFSHPSPRFCLLAVGALTQAYIDYNVESQQNLRAVEYYGEQIRLLQVDLDSLLVLREAIHRENGLNAFHENVTNGINHMRGLEYTFLTTRSERLAQTEHLAGLRRAVIEDPDYVPALRMDQHPSLVQLKGYVEELKANLAKLSVAHTADSEWVRRQKSLLQEARLELDRERANYIRDLETQIRQTAVKESEFGGSIAELKKQLEAYPEVERRIGAVEVQIESRRDLMETLQMKRGEVRLKAESDRRISNITQIDEPSLNVVVQGGKKVLYLVMASMLALILGFMGALFVESQDHRLYTKFQAEQYLEVPVLASVSTAQMGGKQA